MTRDKITNIRKTKKGKSKRNFEKNGTYTSKHIRITQENVLKRSSNRPQTNKTCVSHTSPKSL